MAYCGAIGSVNVLEFMSTDIFDESQENPFLLQAPLSVSHSKQYQQQHSLGDGLAPSSPQRHSLVASALELPLHDPQDSAPPTIDPSPHYAQTHYMQSPAASPTRSASQSSSGRASVTLNLSKSILKRQSSYESDISTAASDAEAAAVDVDVNETELHKLLYSLARFSVASETSACSMADSPSPVPYQLHQHSMSQPASPVPAFANTSSLWFRGADNTTALKSRHATKKKPRSKSADRTGYETDPDSEYYDDDDGGYASSGDRSAMHSRGSVTFEMVKNLLRGGGGTRTSRIVQRTIPGLRRQSMGTVSSRLKCRQKFAQPTILTDAYHRVSTMKLGTKPMPVKVKHLAFPELQDPAVAEGEADPGMPSPKGQLRATSLILLDTLDKIGTRAACPVHLIDEETPDYSNVLARVASHNRIVRPKTGLRRPSAWLAA